MKILQVTEALEGGILGSISQLCNGLSERGHQVFLAYSKRPETPDNLHAYFNKEIVLFEVKLNREINLFKDIKGLINFYFLFKKVQPEIIHLHSSKAGVLGKLSSIIYGKKHRVFYSPRGLSFLQSNESQIKLRFYKTIEKIMSNINATTVACSESEKDEINFHLNCKNLVLIENAIPTDIIFPKSHNDNDIIIIGTSGRLCYQKDPELFLKIVKKINCLNKQINKDIKFIWVGDGQFYKNELQAAGVEVTGWLQRSEVLRTISKFDIYLQTSKWEGMPISVIESQVAGIPAVVTDVVGNRDVIENRITGFVSNEIDDLSRHLINLIEDKGLRLQMGSSAREKGLVRFNLNRMLDEYEALYLEYYSKT